MLKKMMSVQNKIDFNAEEIDFSAEEIDFNVEEIDFNAGESHFNVEIVISMQRKYSSMKGKKVCIDPRWWRFF